VSHHYAEEGDERLVTLKVEPRSASRRVADVAMIVALLGIAIPFGLHNVHNYRVNTYEWILAALALIAAVGMATDFALPRPQAWPFLLAAFTWAAQAAYAAELPGAVIAARVGLAMLFGGWAILAAGAWRITVLARRRR
jgi:hypothetical protein